MGLVHEKMTDDTPLYLQVEARLREGLMSGLWPVDQALPPERLLAEELGVSRKTIRKALEALEREGAVVRRRGSGTYASTKVSVPTVLSHELLAYESAPPLTSFTEEMRARGVKTHAEWLDRSVTVATSEEAMSLALSPQMRVARMRRVRYANDTPVCIEHAVFPIDVLPDPESVDGSIYAHLDVHHARPVRALQHLHAVALEPREATLLHAQPGDAAFYTKRLAYLANGRPVEYTIGYYRADQYDFIIEVGNRF